MEFLSELNINWSELLYGGFMIGLLRLIWDAYKFIKSIKANKNDINIKDTVDDVVSNSVQIQYLLSNFINETSIQHALIVKAEIDNNSSIIDKLQFNNNMHITILYEAINSKYINIITPFKNDINKYHIHPEYKELLYDLVNNKEIEILPEQTNIPLLKQISKANDIKIINMYLIDVADDNGILYLALHSDSIDGTIRQRGLDYMTAMLIKKIKDLVKKIYNLKNK